MSSFSYLETRMRTSGPSAWDGPPSFIHAQGSGCGLPLLIERSRDQHSIAVRPHSVNVGADSATLVARLKSAPLPRLPDGVPTAANDDIA